MKFRDYPNFYHYCRSINDPNAREAFNDFYGYQIGVADDSHFRDQMTTEWRWFDQKRPYYNVWPAVVKSFLKLDLSKVPAKSIKFPTQTLLFRFADESRVSEFEFGGKKWFVRSVLIGMFKRRTVAASNFKSPDDITEWLKDPRKTGEVSKDDDMTAYIDIGETEPGTPSPGCPLVSWRQFQMRDGESIAESMQRSDNIHWTAEDGVAVPTSLFNDVFKVICACGLLETDAGIIVPDVMEKHKARFDATGDAELILKAIRNGKRGWNVGEELHKGHAETSPHFRSPHAALYWTGPGRQVPVIRFRHGPNGGPIVVKRADLLKVPTGYLDKPETKDA